MNKTVFTDHALLNEISRFAKVKTIQKDDILINPGSKILFVPIVQKGVLRIMRQDDDGREVFLYHIYPGQTCAMAINCCQGHKESMIKAVAEDETEILQIPANLVEEWFKYPEWKIFINNTYSQRFADLLEVIDLIAFHNMDKQVLHYLKEKAKATNNTTINITHQQIADELHTHREAISRLLRTMEHKKFVRLGRNTIELLST